MSITNLDEGGVMSMCEVDGGESDGVHAYAVTAMRIGYLSLCMCPIT